MTRFGREIPRRLLFFLLAFCIVTTAGRIATAAQGTLSWNDTSSNEDGFKIERKTGTNGAYAQIAVTAMNTATYLDSTLSDSTQYCYRVRAYNTAGDSAFSNESCSTTATLDTQAPTVSLTVPGNSTTSSGPAVTVSANASDNIGVVGVQFLLDGVNLGSEDATAPYSISWNTTTVANGAHTLTARARDAAGNQAVSTAVTVTVSNAALPPVTGGLVTAYAFDENNGTSTMDASGLNNTGTLSGATWTTSGKFGNALSFNGTNARVTIPDTASLDLTTGMTLEAWVYPTALSGGTTNGWRTVILKEAGNTASYDLYANQDTNRPSSYLSIGGINRGVVGPSQLPLNTWTHLAATYDGAQQRLFINGTQVAQRAQSGSALISSGPLRIGGNSVWGEFFQGVIDNVRIYKSALTAAQIQANMNIPIAP